jgi:hypothetical protein
MIFFTQVNDEMAIDQIPLAEIQSIREMEDIDEEAMESSLKNGFMVETHPEGYNSGRTYYLQAESKASCQDITRKLSQYSAAAQEKAHARSVFAQAQRKVDKVYRSTIFQTLIALLIVAVRWPCLFA